MLGRWLVFDGRWVEGEHPRDEGGKFGEGGGASGSAAPLSTSKGAPTGGIEATYNPATKSYSAPGVSPARLKALALPPAWKGVRISSDEAAPLQAIGLDAKGRAQYRYSDEFAKSQSAKKFARIGTLVKKRAALRTATEEGTRKGDPTSAAVRLMLLTGMRPGGDEDTQAKEKAFGATTLLKQHVKVKGNVISYDFIGKKGVPIKGRVQDEALAAFVGRALKAGFGGDRLFETNASRANTRVKSIVGGDYKCKDLRTLKANELAAATIKAHPVPTDDKTKKAAIKHVATVVSAQLGNTPTVALKDYINPIVFSSWDKVA